jgi:ankyrin repeat protein
MPLVTTQIASTVLRLRESQHPPIYDARIKQSISRIMSVADSQSDDFDIIDSREASLGPEALEKLQKWLQPTDYMAESSEFRRHLSSQAPGTGLWICDTERFKQWHDSADHGSLWIKGAPGAGKSVIAASMVEYLRSQEDVPMLFFFFRYIIAANRRPRSLIRDWLAQLLPHSLRLQASLQPMLACELNDLSDERLWEHLLIGLSSVEKAYCVVDALDEMELVENDAFLVRLNSLATFRSNCVKLLITSRPKQYLQSAIRDTSIVHINLENDLVGKDIAHFVSHRLKTAIPEDGSAGLLDSLLSTICMRSRGLFLYARLLLDQITPVLQSEKQLDAEALAKSLPIGLEDMYNCMLSQQAQVLNIETSIQVFLLGCTIHSSRNLRLNELADFLQFKFPPSMIPGTPKAIARTACAPLLEIMEDETIQVIHHSFTEFLLDRQRTTRLEQTARQFPVLDPQDVHRMLTMECLVYLQSGVLESQEPVPRGAKDCGCNGDKQCFCEDEKGRDDEIMKPGKYDYQQARLHHPFLNYAVQNWGYHASKYDVEDESLFVSIKNFTEADSVFRRWLSLVKTAKYLRPAAKAPSLLHIAAFAGLTQFAKHLLLAGHSVDSRDAEKKTPLLWESSGGHAQIVSLLLEHGAEPDAEDYGGVKPIHLAARQNSYRIVKMLLEAGVDPLSPKTKEYLGPRGEIMGRQQRTKGNTAVQYVCQQGHTETILVMIPFLQPETLEEVLCETCRYGKFESARAILENSDVSVNSKFSGATALYLACVAKSVDCVQILLDRGADINLISEWKPLHRIYGGSNGAQSPRTPLQGLTYTWIDGCHPACAQIFQMLLRAGADLNEKDTKGETPLLSQFKERGAPSILAVRTLLEAGANISDVYNNGDTVLHRCLSTIRDIEMLDLLLKYGADVTACGNQGNTVLHDVFGKGYSLFSPKNSVQEIVEYFLEKGAPAHVKNAFGRSATEVGMSSISCNLEIFRALLRSCPDESIRKQCLWLIGSKYGKEQVQFVRELQAVGMSLDARNSNGETVLLTTIQSGDTWKALVECGASLDAIDSKGRGALHHFIRSDSSTGQLQALIDAGLDPHKTDGKGETLLHIAARGYQGTEREVKLIEYLLNLGHSVNAKTKLGHTPLQLNIENAEQRLRSFSFNEPPRVPLLSVFQKSGDMLDVNIRDNEGFSALHLSAMRSEFDVARLLDTGADPTLVTKDGRTALHLACRARRSGVVGLLLHKVSLCLSASFLCVFQHWNLLPSSEFRNYGHLYDSVSLGRLGQWLSVVHELPLRSAARCER